jgi:hypothetical protein
MYWVLVTLSLLAFDPFASDLGSIRTEPNLERRSELALDYANTALDQARESYSTGDVSKTETSLNEVRESVDLAYQSLEDSGKDPRRSSKFKTAEVKTRALLRRLEGLRQSVGFEDRALVEKVRDRVSEIHDNLLKGIMSKKK